MTACWTCDLCIWHYTEWWWTRDLCICHYTEWQHVGLVICVSDILQNDAMLDSWSVYLTFYRMTPCWTHDLCIWHYTEWLHVGLVICIWHYIEWRHVGLVMCIWHYTWWCNIGLMICVSDILQNDAMLDSWSMYLALYRMMLDSWSVHLTLYRMTPCWTRDLCIWSTEWLHVGLVICASDIIQNDAMLDSWSVFLTYRMTPCRTRDLCIWHNTEWRHVGLVICVSDIIQNDDGLVICVSAIIQNDNMLDSWSVYLTFYRMTPCWTRDLCIWHFTEWCHVGLVICVSDIQNDSM